MALFGTNGVRGKLDALTPQLAFLLAASFAAWCKPGASIALARDMRLTSPMLHSAAASGMMSAGRNVLDLGLCSSPVAEFTSERHHASGLVIVTASHNAPEWNALKFVDGRGIAVSRERGMPMEKTVLSGSCPLAEWDKAGRIIPMPDASARHAKEALKNVDSGRIRARKLRLALDFGNGTSALSRSVFESLGCEIFALNGVIDGKFPGRPSEPAEANVQGLCKAVQKESCDFGVAWDGDSDRVVFVDEKGGWIVGDKGFAVSALAACRARKAQKGKSVVTTVATSRCVEEACAEEGAKTVYTKVGAPYLSEKMVELGDSAVSGGEEVGGIIWPEFSLAKDGIFAAAKMAEMVCERGLSEIVGELPVYYNSKSRIEAAGDAAKKAGLSSALAASKGMGGKVNTIDGVRIDFADGWAIVRASGTENYMRIFAEGKTQARADALLKEFVEVVKKGIGV